MPLQATRFDIGGVEVVQDVVCPGGRRRSPDKRYLAHTAENDK